MKSPAVSVTMLWWWYEIYPGWSCCCSTASYGGLSWTLLKPLCFHRLVSFGLRNNTAQNSNQFFRPLCPLHKNTVKTAKLNVFLSFNDNDNNNNNTNNNKYFIYRGWNTPFVFSTSETQGTLARSPSVTYITSHMQILEKALFEKTISAVCLPLHVKITSYKRFAQSTAISFPKQGLSQGTLFKL